MFQPSSEEIKNIGKNIQIKGSKKTPLFRHIGVVIKNAILIGGSF